MIFIKDLAIQYGGKLLFEGVDLLLNQSNRYAIVGANGTGKSTLLRLMMQEESPSLGEIVITKSKQVGWVKQDHFHFEQNRIIDVVLMGKSELWKALADKDALLNAPWTDASADQLGHLEETIAHYNGYAAESLAHILLEGLGIPQAKHFDTLSTLSGGYKMRVLLAQALFEEPDILLLDEPTNHLDIMTIAWLEAYLINEFKGLLVFVSHDIKFLNKISTHVLDIDYGEVREYVGDYNLFLVKKKEIAEQKLSEKKYAEDKLAHMQKFVERFGAKASKARQAQSRVKMMEKIELPDIKNSSRMSPNFHFECKRPSGKVVLTLDKVVKTYGEKNVLNNVSFSVNKDEKVAIIGHNGIGKSTLLKIAMQALEPTSGKSEWGYETHVSYFAQDHHEQLNQSMSVLEWLTQQCPKESSASIRNVLGQVLFVKEEVESNILHISGGEAARLLIAKMMLEKPNVLVLDEPTNHLDIEGIEALIKALKAYKGTLILVSHDRHFVGQIVNRVVALSEAGYKDYKGTYNQFLKYYGEDYLSQSFLAKK